MNKREHELKKRELQELVGKKHYFSRKGMVAYHSDGMKHFQAKAMLGYILRKNEHEFATELEFPNGVIADVMDLSTFLVYELESNYTDKDKKEKMDNFWAYDEIRDVFVIDPQRLSDDINEMKEELEQKLVL